VLAVDCLIAHGGTLAELAPETVAALDAALPATWSRGNPVDIIGDANAARYRAALEALLGDPGNDGVLVVQVATALTDAVAEAVVDVVAGHRRALHFPKPVLALWMGGGAMAAHLFESASIPVFGNEADAIRGFRYLTDHRRTQVALTETPEPLPDDFQPDIAAARAVVARALADGRSWLTPVEANDLLTAYHIPVAPLFVAADPEEAVAAAAPLLRQGRPVALKILSPDIQHKSDIGGVMLDLASEDAVRAGAADILARARRQRPEARITGLLVQAMVSRPHARELIAGAVDDETFGPVVLFGHGGVAVEIVDDRAIGLPPLDMKFAADMIGRTKIARLLKAYRNVPAADEKAVAITLVKLSQLVVDVPEIRAMDLNPLLADADGVVALDSRVTINPAKGEARDPYARFAMRPYPREWEREVETAAGTRYRLRPIRPEDEPALMTFVNSVSEDDLRKRFFGGGQKFTHAFIARLVQLDYARAIAFVALEAGSGRIAGVVRLHADVNHEEGEYAILVRSDLKGTGLGRRQMELMIAWAHADGISRILGQVLGDNRTMLAMCRELGFRTEADPDDPALVAVTLDLRQLGPRNPVEA
jgi:acetyltransferase